MSRLVLRLCLGMLFVLVASAFVVTWGMKSGMERSFARNLPVLLSAMMHAREHLEQAPPARRAHELERLRAQVKLPVKLLPPRRLPPDLASMATVHRPFVSITRGEGVTAYLPLQRGAGVLVLGPLEGMARTRDFPLLPLLGALTGIVALAGVFLAAPMVRRLSRLERVALRISEGDLDARAEESSPDAIGNLARRFNVMADRVQALLQSQRRLIQAVSHELRTPTARIRFGLEMLSLAKTEEDRQRRIDAMDEDLTELDQLVEELLVFMRAGEQISEEVREVLPGAALVRQVARRLRDLRPEVQIEVVPGEDAEVQVHAAGKAFRRVIQNLLTNALRYARENVTVRLERRDETVLMIVSDDGPGVPVADRERIFEPFARVDDSRSRESGGTGLGLAIVRRIVVSHGGRVSVSEAAEGGARFVCSWPAAGDAPS